MTEQNFSFAVVTMSDKGARGERVDTSGEYLRATLSGAGFTENAYRVIPDSKETIVSTIVTLTDQQEVDLVVTTGGTGLSPTDVTPQAMEEILDYEIPGMAEAMRAASMKITPRAMLSRAMAGVRGASMIINLPGSLKAVRENLEVVMPVLEHGLEKLKGSTEDCGRT